FTLSLRVSGKPGRIDVLRGDRVLGSVIVDPDGNSWRTVTATISLAKGAQTVRLRLAKDQSVNWLSFVRTAEP
ncbi:MAG: hypothetical protein ABUL72_03150, partial [Armatimonadota bacterium]